MIITIHFEKNDKTMKIKSKERKYLCMFTDGLKEGTLKAHE